GFKRTTVQEAIEALRAAGHLQRVGGGKRGDPYRYHVPNGFCRNSIPTNGRELSQHEQAAGLASAETPAGFGRKSPEPETSDSLHDVAEIEGFLRGGQP